MTERWMLGSTTPKKVIHREGCRYALTLYVWANVHGPTVEALASALVDDPSEAWLWHKACAFCCADLAEAVHGRLCGDEATT